MKLKTPLAIVGRGAVTPEGLGLPALLRTEANASSSIESLRHPGRHYPVRRVALSDLARWQNEPRLRRASAISLFIIEAASQALAEAGEQDPSRLGLIVAFGTGAMIYSRRFFEEVIRNGPKFASPALFPETVFNSPASHVASVLKINGPGYSLVGDSSAWVNALGVASVWLETNLVDAAVVVGVEELDPISVEAYATARWIRSGWIPAEGAGAVVLKKAAGPGVAITDLVEGYTYRRKEEEAQAAHDCWAELDGERRIYPTACLPRWKRMEKEMIAAAGKQENQLPYERGQAFSASAAWHTLIAAQQLSPEQSSIMVPVWGENEQCGALRLEHSPGKP